MDKFGIGVSYLVLALLTNESASAAPTYGNKLETSSTNAINYSPTTANATADGDNRQVANITTVTTCTVEWTGWGVPDDTYAVIFGHATPSSEGQIDESFSDVAPYVGMGYIRKLRTGSTDEYRAYWYYKMQAVPGEEQQTTQGQELNLGATVVTFNGAEPLGGSGFRSIKSFTTEAAAKEWLDAFCGSTTD